MKCPNCAAILPLKLISPGTVQCEYCGNFISVGAIPLYESNLNFIEEKEVDLLQISDSMEFITEAIKNTSVTFEQAANAINNFAKIAYI